MAAVVSHAMRRFASSPDTNYSSCGLRSESSRLNWSSESESSLSRSMRYADPWLYDGVRPPNGLLLAPALVICSCPDYLNGTKRSNKKGPSTCKKCKGTRIPLSATGDSKFGTMRCYPTTPFSPSTPTRAGTVRVTSSSRPSILPSADPYDLMRRSRLTVKEKPSMSMSSTGSQFRARSVSPTKGKSSEQRGSSSSRKSDPSGGKSGQKIKYSTVGRRSILECNVNPYELMSTGLDADTSITLVNGQRIRVRPPLSFEQDYEDVHVQLKTPMKLDTSSKSQIPIPKLQLKLKKNTVVTPQSPRSPTPVKPNEKEVSDGSGNRFKSILKKPTATFGDTDSSSVGERSPSPGPLKSGSHFYLPMPTTPRKKVQFLVAMDDGGGDELTTNYQTIDDHYEDPEVPSSPEYTNSPTSQSSDEDDGTEQQNNYEVTIFQTATTEASKQETQLPTGGDCDGVSETPTLASCRLRRSESERTLKEQASAANKVIFHDSMALRTQQSRVDARIVFTDKDLERLDGVTARLAKSHRPSGPPPQPPAAAAAQHAGTPDEPPSAPPRKRSSHKQPLANATPNNTDTCQTQQQSNVDLMKTKQTFEEGPTKQPEKVFVKPDVGMGNRTVLKINNGEVHSHKVKIKNEFSELASNVNINTIAISDSTLGKTSIMINGDDCYSTIKVCDEIPLYHSSVVVKDSGIITVPEKRSSSSVYITGNFVNTFDNNDKKQFDYEDNKPKSTSPETSSQTAETTEIIPSETNTKDQNNSITTIEEPKETHEEAQVVLRNKNLNNTDLLKCLSNPVEAVRMNLVPHICGRHDKPRRPREQLPKRISPEPLKELQTLSEEDKVAKFIEDSFLKLRNNKILDVDDKDSEHSSSTQYEIIDHGSDCYTDHSNRSSITEEELNARTKFYELLADSAIVEVSEGDDHHYESIKINQDPIYEEIEIPPPLPANPPPTTILDELQLDKEYTTRSIFEGASKYDILSYLVDAKERGIVPEDSYTYNFDNTNGAIEEEGKDAVELPYNRVSHLSTVSDSSEDSSLVMSCSLTDDKVQRTAEVERNDSGVGSETSKSSLSKYRTKADVINVTCEDCDSSLDAQSQSEHEPLVCRKCVKKRTERKEIITEIVETEEKYSRDLQIILEEFYQPMLVAGLLTSDQLSAIFLNVEELLENSQALAERLRDAVEIAVEQGDEDLQTVNIGKLILEAAPMLHAFETYCVRQGAASLLLASLEKDKELLRIFLRVSQMENAVLRRMNLNSFLMVPVQRVTKYPLLLARLYKVTPSHYETRDQLKEAQHKIELHLNHMNSETKDVPSKLWRRISSIPGRRSSSEMDLVNIKLRKIAVDVLEWNHDEAKFALEGRLLYTQPTDNNWRKGRTIKLTPINALLVTNGKSTSTRTTDNSDESLVFSRQAGVRDAALLLVRDKNGRYTLLREPLYLDRCVIAADPAWQSYFEVQELLGKDTFIFKAEDEEQTKLWYRQLQYYAQGMGAWRKRRNALANIMINGMGLRS